MTAHMTYDLREAAQYVIAHSGVHAADVLTDDTGAYVEFVIRSDDTTPPGVPPAVLETLAERGLAVTDVTSGGEATHYVVTAR